MAKEPDRELRTLEYPKNFCQPKELLTFTQSKEYTTSFIRMNLTDDEQRAIEIGVMLHPLICPVIEGTGGIRKFRFSTTPKPAASLQLSAYYAYFPEDDAVVLIDLVHTDEVGGLTDEEKGILKQLFDEIQPHTGRLAHPEMGED